MLVFHSEGIVVDLIVTMGGATMEKPTTLLCSDARNTDKTAIDLIITDAFPLFFIDAIVVVLRFL